MNKFKSHEPFRVGFLLFPDFPLLSYASAVDVLRLANLHTGETLYHWQTFSLDGKSFHSSSGLNVVPDDSIWNAGELDMLVLVSSVGSIDFNDPKLLTFLRRRALKGIAIGGLTLASYVLARAGLLDGYRCTVHWEFIDSFREQFPHLNVTPDVIEIDRNRYTSSGATASLDLMLGLVRQQHDKEIAAKVADLCIHHRIRDARDVQRMPLRTRVNISHPKLLKAIEIMESASDQPFMRDGLSHQVGLTGRQIERLFRKYLGVTPRQYHLNIRLDRARRLLQQTSLPIIQVAIAAGFATASHFSKAYRERFACTPSNERRLNKELMA